MAIFIRKDKSEELKENVEKTFPNITDHFSGSTPPEVFVGRVNYPNVFSGILSPAITGNTQNYSSPKEWVKNKLNIEQVASLRKQMIYARKVTNIKKSEKFNEIKKEIALSSKPVSIEVFLDRPPSFNSTNSPNVGIMSNPTNLKRLILQENPFIESKVEYITSDYDLKSSEALRELYNKNINVEHIQKLLSVGLLGLKKNRKMVPTRWSITCVDDILGKSLIKKIKSYPTLEEFRVFRENYNGNYYTIILLPGNWSFEVVEFSLKQNNSEKLGVWTDYEGFFERKKYASGVTGAYYANRLAVCEYLEKIKKQASVLVYREITEEYYLPLGVGILRETTRKAMQNPSLVFENLNYVLDNIKNSAKIDITNLLEISKIIKNYGKQKRIFDFI